MKTTKELMKKTILITMLALLGITQAIAQEYEYVPFVREGVKWVYFVKNTDDLYGWVDHNLPEADYYLTLELKGDTVINGLTYKAMHKYYGDNINAVNDTIPIYLREDDKVVYGINPDGMFYHDCPIYNNCSDVNTYNGQEFVLYDFKNPIEYWSGFTLFDYPFYEYQSTDTIVIGNHAVKRYNGLWSGVDFQIIEGVGADTQIPGYTLCFFMSFGKGIPLFQLSYVIEDDEIIYKSKWYEEPQPEEYEYIPFVREGVKWVYSIQDYHYEEEEETNPARGDNKVYRTLEIKGDTVINGKTYKAMHKCTDDMYSEPSDVIPIYLREEDKMVYGIVPDGKYYDDALIGAFGPWGPWHDEIYSGKEFLLYDFRDPIAFLDSIDPDRDLHLQVDTIEVGGRYAKRYYYGEQEWIWFQIIEGIGATGMNSYPLAFLMPECTGVHCTEYYSLEKVIENGEVIYPQNYVEDRYLPVIREGVKWVNEYVKISDEDTTKYYYTYEFKGNYPERDSYNRVFKAVYSKNYDSNGASYGEERLVAGLREYEACILSFRNEPLGWMNNYINFYIYQGNEDVRLLHENLEGMWDIDYYINHQSYPHMNLLNTDNFVKADPIEIDGVLCSRIAYIGEQGDTLAYLVEGIGFDSFEWGDLLTPFTQYPDADCGCHKEYCGLSHVIKDGKIIYKGMRYRHLPGDVNGDGEVTVADANSVVDIVVMGGNSGHTRAPQADVNGDDEINIADINAIIDLIIKND